MRAWIAILISLSLQAITIPSFASSESYRHALIIGIAVYRDRDVPPLFGVPNDMDSAREIAGAIGVPRDNITELFNEAATKQGITGQLQRLSRESRDGGKVLIYFSGHGTRWRDSSSGGCVEGLLTWDRKAIVNREFAQLVRPIGLKAENLIIMFDACHSDGVYGRTRSMGSISKGAMTPKFFVRSDQANNDCNRPSNVRTRSLNDPSEGLISGSSDNIVHITSARADEVSFDEPGKGGLATQAIKHCMFGGAADVDGSGAIALNEIQSCAQEHIRSKLKRFPDLLPHHVSVRGFRNLIPVPVQIAGAQAHRPQGSPSSAPSADEIRAEKERLTREERENLERRRQDELRLSRERADRAKREQELVAEQQAMAEAERQRLKEANAKLERQQLAASYSEALAQEKDRLAQIAAQIDLVLAEEIELASAEEGRPVGPVATLDNIFDQRDTRRKVGVNFSKETLRINRDPFAFTVTSSHEGYVYVFLLGSDETSFYMLFPNELDRANRINANSELKLPRPHWAINAAGPPGVDRLLVLVTETPRAFDALVSGTLPMGGPLALTPASIEGRQRLVDFILGSGVRGSGRYWAARADVREIP
jgi:hypothetical protein